MRASEKVLDIARRYEHPLIVNTKSSRIVELEGLRRALEALLDYGLAVLQVSLFTLDDSKSKALEPVAPPPSMRLLMLRDFGSRRLPVVVRLSPYVPHYSPTAEEVKRRAGALQRRGGQALNSGGSEG
jgi:DNA repair photolyase